MKIVIIVSLLWGSFGIYLSEKSEHSHPRVVTPLGTIEGSYDVTNGDRRVEVYKGIPYAQPPIGDFRFRTAASVLPWTGVLMAKRFGSPCMQYNFLLNDSSDKVSGSEDCLYMNVYAPIAGDNRNEVNGTRANRLPVIFFVPGGAFFAGSGNQHGYKYLLDRNVILVTFNYRVGPLGFLSTEDDVVPGNMGLKDQVVALRWVNDNIRHFGGDPSAITIVGQSAGGVSVHYHYLTNLTAGLFQRGMSLSGTAFHSWAQVRNPLEKAKQLATVVGCLVDNIQAMVDCLRTRPGHQIVEAVNDFKRGAYYPPIGWGPTVEKRGGEFTFIDRSPVDIISSGDVQDVPWLTGVVSQEGLFPSILYTAKEERLASLDDEWETLAPYILSYNDTISGEDHPEVARLIKQHYLGQSPISRTTFNETVQMIGNRMFVYAVENAAISQARVNRSPVHVYYFSYRGAHSNSESLSGKSENFGVCHGDDLRYVLNSNFDATTTARDREMQDVLIDLWVSFATDGTLAVGVEWPRLSQSPTGEFRYLDIAGPKEIGMKSASNFGDKNFWSTLGFRENML